MNNIQSELASSDTNQNLQNFLQKVFKIWYWFVLSIAIFGIGAYLYLRYATPIYKINAQVLVKEDKANGIGGKGELIDLNSVIGGVSSVDNEVMVLKTRSLMNQVVKELNSNITYYQQGSFRRTELATPPFYIISQNSENIESPSTINLRFLNKNELQVFSDSYTMNVRFNEFFRIPGLGTIKIVRNIASPYSSDTYICDITSAESKVANYLNNLQVAVSNKQVSIIDISLTYPVKEKGELILSTLIEKYVQGNIKDKNIIADSTIAFIENRLKYVSEELGDIEGSIQRFRQESRITDIEMQSKLLLENSSESVQEINKVETQIAILNSLNEYLLNKSNNNRVLPNSVLPDDITFRSLIERYNSLLLERDRQSLSSTDSNPHIVSLDEQISTLQNELIVNLENTKKSLLITRNALKKSTGKVENEIRRVPASQRTFLDMARQQQIKQELYVFLLQKREETAISKTSNISNSKVIDQPKSNDFPVSPNKSAIMLLAFLTGIGIPLSILMLKERLNTLILNKDDIIRLSEIPIIAEISNNADSSALVVTETARTPIAEQFRALRTNLMFFLKEGEKTVLLTSSMSGEGKSFVALNMASVLAISGKKVVVMELDLRKPNLSNKINKQNTFGFTNYIVSDISPESVVAKSGIHENLSIVSSGTIPPNPTELLLDSKTKLIMEYLKANFDYIIIDAPPVGLVTDAQLLSDYADLTIYLVRQGYTYKEQLTIANELYYNKKMKKIGLLVNGIKTGGSYGYGYGYGQGYGSYAVDDIKESRWKFFRS